eukprot:TRINITY_DN12351_c0_g3_i8.p1 TRINITY_DN12351_c0_g3~~TRINITY_DN12351_c0_g3_i8.p1  ORF type:complete len:172 (+),score=26.70 TRINITY_DN12351_c0_g3_i8:70-585(+)
MCIRDSINAEYMGKLQNIEEAENAKRSKLIKELIIVHDKNAGGGGGGHHNRNKKKHDSKKVMMNFFKRINHEGRIYSREKMKRTLLNTALENLNQKIVMQGIRNRGGGPSEQYQCMISFVFRRNQLKVFPCIFSMRFLNTSSSEVCTQVSESVVEKREFLLATNTILSCLF